MGSHSKKKGKNVQSYCWNARLWKKIKETLVKKLIFLGVFSCSVYLNLFEGAIWKKFKNPAVN